MKLLINTSNIVVGGGIQVSLSFLEALKNHSNNEYHVFLSPAVGNQLDLALFGDNFSFYDIPISPSKIKSGFKIRKQLSNLESVINPDLVFTVFGPAYWSPKSLHVSGFANGWCYNPHSIAFDRLGTFGKIKSKLLIKLKNYFIKKSDYLIVETKTAKQNIIKYLHYNGDEIFVVGNTFHQIFKKAKALKKSTNESSFKLLVLSSFYPNKNLSIINEVVQQLSSKSKIKFKFLLTLPEDTFNENFAKHTYIKNIGLQRIEDCPRLYINADALFLPTLLETFTANYPEAMKMQTPILTSNLDFARELCGEAALYFDPLSAEDIANKIIELQSNQVLQEELIEKGSLKLKEFESAESRTSKYLDIFTGILDENKKQSKHAYTFNSL